KSVEMGYVLYTNDVEAYRNQPLHFEVKVCNEATKSCELLAKSKTFKYSSNDKAFMETLSVLFTKQALAKALGKLNVTAENARLSYGTFSPAETLRLKTSERSGNLSSYFQKESGREAEQFYFHPKDGIVETSYVQIFTR
ncbi:MAG: hypothetical protein AABZ31_06580, partial [Bdellovibrionota bacterium]